MRGGDIRADVVPQGVDIVENTGGQLDDEVLCGALPRPPENLYIVEAVRDLNVILLFVDTIEEVMSDRKPDAVDFGQALPLLARSPRHLAMSSRATLYHPRSLLPRPQRCMVVSVGSCAYSALMRMWYKGASPTPWSYTPRLSVTDYL